MRIEQPPQEKLDIRPRCIGCGERWMPPEGVDAQVEPCDTCSPITLTKAQRWRRKRED